MNEHNEWVVVTNSAGRVIDKIAVGDRRPSTASADARAKYPNAHVQIVGSSEPINNPEAHLSGWRDDMTR